MPNKLDDDLDGYGEHWLTLAIGPHFFGKNAKPILGTLLRKDGQRLIRLGPNARRYLRQRAEFRAGVIGWSRWKRQYLMTTITICIGLEIMEYEVSLNFRESNTTSWLPVSGTRVIGRSRLVYDA